MPSPVSCTPLSAVDARVPPDGAGADPELAVTFRVGDASDPELVQGSYDVVLSRHVLWALPDPAAGLARWIRLLAPGGRLIAVTTTPQAQLTVPARDLVFREKRPRT